MNAIGAAIILHGASSFRLSALRDTILAAYAASLTGEEASQPASWLQPLIDAYVALKLEEDAEEDKDTKLVSGQEAEETWRQQALAGYQATFPEIAEGDESVPWWPDELATTTSYTPDIIADLAYLTGFQAGRSTKAAYAYFAAHVRREEHSRAQAILDGRTP